MIIDKLKLQIKVLVIAREYDQVVYFLATAKILDLFQTGFRKYHNTQTALLKLTDDIRVGKGNRLATLMLQFNFSKAFDTISPSRLLRKLMRLCFSRIVLSWFWSYLCGRSQCVFSRSSASEYRNIRLGVPQGSVLGSLLFCLYINDLKCDGVSPTNDLPLYLIPYGS